MSLVIVKVIKQSEFLLRMINTPSVCHLCAYTFRLWILIFVTIECLSDFWVLVIVSECQSEMNI